MSSEEADLLLADLEKRKLGKAARPRKSRGNLGAGTIGRAARREVFERDGERCSYVSEDGRRCEAKAFTELDRANREREEGVGKAAT